jgi:hypothetical protein
MPKKNDTETLDQRILQTVESAIEMVKTRITQLQAMDTAEAKRHCKKYETVLAKLAKRAGQT